MTRTVKHVGYARVSTHDQNLDLQLRALKAAGCKIICTDQASGADFRRKGLGRAIRKCAPGDVLVVWKLDRLGRSLIDLVGLIELLNEYEIGLKVLTGQGAYIDTTTAEGRMLFGILATLAEFERELIRERTLAGMAAARARGVHVGRPYKLSDKDIRKMIGMLDAGQTRKAVGEAFGISQVTLRRTLARFAQKGKASA